MSVDFRVLSHVPNRLDFIAKEEQVGDLFPLDFDLTLKHILSFCIVIDFEGVDFITCESDFPFFILAEVLFRRMFRNGVIARKKSFQ